MTKRDIETVLDISAKQARVAFAPGGRAWCESAIRLMSQALREKATAPSKKDLARS